MTAGSADPYWVDLLTSSGEPLGAGLFFTRRWVLTADHCLERLPEGGETDVLVECASGGTVLKGRISERRPDVDLAVVEVTDRRELKLRMPEPEDCAAGDEWVSPYRPDPSWAVLQGKVMEAPVQYVCMRGGEIDGVQLIVDGDIGDYKGYSGAPVEASRKADVGRTPFGMLIEQYPDQSGIARASPLLFAVTLRFAGQAFSHFDISNLSRIIETACRGSRAAEVSHPNANSQHQDMDGGLEVSVVAGHDAGCFPSETVVERSIMSLRVGRLLTLDIGHDVFRRMERWRRNA